MLGRLNFLTGKTNKKVKYSYTSNNFDITEQNYY